MKLLLVENLPKRLKSDFPEHKVSTVRGMGWSGKTNGELLRLMIENNFRALLTFDKNIEHQQNFLEYPICVLVLSSPSNQYKHLTLLSSSIRGRLGSLSPGVTVITAQ